MESIYEVPESIDELFSDVVNNDGYMSYRIMDNGADMSMDNQESLSHFIELVNISDDYIDENLGTQVTLSHPDYDKRIVIDSGGLGDFFSHGFECNVHEEDI